MTRVSLQVMRLGANLLGFYEGRTPGIGDDPSMSWVEDGALSLGICSYALIDGSEAIVYDTHVSVDRGRTIRDTLERLGARHIRVVLSHWHLDHIAGSEAFADCEIIANRLTAELLADHRAAIEAGTLNGPPPIAPLVLPTTTFEDRMSLTTTHLQIELLQFDIHSQDQTVIHLPAEGLLFAADTLEDTITYVSEPERLELHLNELERMRRLGAARILPNHGSRERIERGGYAPTLTDATECYIRDLLNTAGTPAEAHSDLQAFVAPQLEAGWIEWFEPYERVHRSNVDAVGNR
jgi:glyoxylase-like metal-dependent hydrolase (beta-lactamase superfamily II)